MKITRKRGDTYADEFIIKSEATGLPINLTGYTFLMAVDPESSPATSDNNLYQLVGTILNAAAGLVEFAPSALQANQLGAYFYDIQMIDGAGRKRTIELDAYIYQQDITKA